MTDIDTSTQTLADAYVKALSDGLRHVERSAMFSVQRAKRTLDKHGFDLDRLQRTSSRYVEDLYEAQQYLVRITELRESTRRATTPAGVELTAQAKIDFLRSWASQQVSRTIDMVVHDWNVEMHSRHEARLLHDLRTADFIARDHLLMLLEDDLDRDTKEAIEKGRKKEDELKLKLKRARSDEAIQKITGQLESIRTAVEYHRAALALSQDARSTRARKAIGGSWVTRW